MSPPAFFLIFLFLSAVTHFLLPVKKVIFAPYTYLGIVLIALGTLLNIWSDLLFKRHKTTVKPHEVPARLVVSGPFRFSRHPMYLGMVMILSGLSTFMGSLTSFISPLAFMIASELMFIRREESNLERVFGREYLDYKQRVRRWI